MNGFIEFSEAFDFCREGNAPVNVVIGDLYKMYPSGRAELISDTSPKEPPWVTEFSELRSEELVNLSPAEEAREIP